MAEFLIGFAGLVIGAVRGAVFGGAMIGGSAAGMGVATGLSAGICGTLEAAREEGLLTPDEVAQALTRAAADAAELAGEDAPSAMAGTADECAEVLDRSRNAVDTLS